MGVLFLHLERSLQWKPNSRGSLRTWDCWPVCQVGPNGVYIRQQRAAYEERASPRGVGGFRKPGVSSSDRRLRLDLFQERLAKGFFN